MAISPVLTWTSLTSVVNNIKRPGKFVTNLLQVSEQTLPTETVEIGTLRGERDVAPFVKSGAEGVLVAGLGQEMFTVGGTNIRIKRPFRASELLFNRRPGTAIFPTEGDVLSATEEVIARDMQYMNDMCENAEEWLQCMALQMVITYNVTDQERYTVTYARDTDHSVTPSIFWNQANSTPTADVHAIKALISEAVGMGVTDAICGAEAAAAVRANPVIAAIINTQANMNAGALNLSQQFRDDGAIWMGKIYDINFWEYPRTVRIAGTATALIRTKYIEFVAATKAAQHVRYYSAIVDMKAFEGGSIQLKKFAKSWQEEDPSALMALINTRPLPVPRIPDSTVSFKAVSG